MASESSFDSPSYDGPGPGVEHRAANRAIRLVSAREAGREGKVHAWRTLAVGRICDECLHVQAKGEFDDAGTCRGRPLWR